jgi:hypothetical protein
MGGVPDMTTPFQQEVRRILETLAFTPFDQCLEIDRQFAQFPARPGIYAVRHRIEGMLYLGKTNGGGGGRYAFLNGYAPEDEGLYDE